MTDTSNPTEITVTGTQAYPVNTPQTFVDIYTFEGGTFSLTGIPGLVVTIQKSIRRIDGTFSITLPPGGPNGPNATPSWTQVITPMSLAVIGQRRGGYARITMVGVVTVPAEQQEWRSGESVKRPITISGRDFGHYFLMQCYYSLWFLGLTGAALTEENAQVVAGAPLNNPSLGANLVSGPPDEVAQAWYNSVMAGTKGIMNNTFVPYNGSKVTFQQAMATVFEKFEADTPSAFGAYLLSTDAAWAEKFLKILPFPWYEFFVITAQPSDYAGVSGGTLFTSHGLGSAAGASPTLVARVNPLPTLTATGSNSGFQFTGINCDAWNALTTFRQKQGFLRSDVGFDESLVANFFTLNPTAYQGTFGQSNANIIPFLVANAAAGDMASIARYGFRPANGELDWLADPTGSGAQQSGGVNNQTFVANCLARFASFYGPQGLMARGSVDIFLRPDIMPGHIFQYQPFKNDEPWLFYIEGIQHTYIFGGECRTTLFLSRGLPASVYNDQSNSGLLYNVHIGNAMRVDGKYQIGLPSGSPPALQSLGPGGQLDFFAQLAKNYITPQAVTAGS